MLHLFFVVLIPFGVLVAAFCGLTVLALILLALALAIATIVFAWKVLLVLALAIGGALLATGAVVLGIDAAIRYRRGLSNRDWFWQKSPDVIRWTDEHGNSWAAIRPSLKES